MSEITFIIMVKNGEKTLKKTLDALLSWPNVLLIDTGSSDNTINIASSFPNVIVKNLPFVGFGKTRQLATKESKTDWVFHLDADEVPCAELLKELGEKKLDPFFAYQVKRDNIFFGKKMNGCSGWSNDYVTRCFHRKNFSYSEDLVHEKIICEKNQIKRLKHTLEHTPYQSFYQMLEKMNHYSELFAKSSKKKPTRLSPFFHGSFAFFKSYFLKLGLIEGYRGLILSFYIAHTSFYKYLKLYQKKHWDF